MPSPSATLAHHMWRVVLLYVYLLLMEEKMVFGSSVLSEWSGRQSIPDGGQGQGRQACVVLSVTDSIYSPSFNLHLELVINHPHVGDLVITLVLSSNPSMPHRSIKSLTYITLLHQQKDDYTVTLLERPGQGEGNPKGSSARLTPASTLFFGSDYVRSPETLGKAKDNQVPLLFCHILLFSTLVH